MENCIGMQATMVCTFMIKMEIKYMIKEEMQYSLTMLQDGLMNIEEKLLNIWVD